jgi:hypothetical protein
VDFPAAALPQQAFDEALDVAKIIPGQVVSVGENDRAMVEHGAVCLFERDTDLGSGASFAGRLLKGAVGQHSRTVGGMEFGEKLRLG